MFSDFHLVRLRSLKIASELAFAYWHELCEMFHFVQHDKLCIDNIYIIANDYAKKVYFLYTICVQVCVQFLGLVFVDISDLRCQKCTSLLPLLPFCF